MKIHSTGPDTLSDYDYQDLKSSGFDEVWYWYESGGWEGSGYLLATRGGKYFVTSLSHCSCNGPLEISDLTEAFDSLEDLRNKSSNDYWQELNNLLLAGMVHDMGF